MTITITSSGKLKRCPSDATDITLDVKISNDVKKQLGRFENVRVVRFDSGSEIADFDGLQSLRNLEVVWAIGQHNLLDMSALTGLISLRELYITAAWQLNPDPLQRMPFLRKLMLDGPRKRMIALSGLRDVEHLELRDVRLNDLKAIRDLEHLRHLEVKSSPLRSLEGFPVRSPVEYADFTRTTISSVDSIAGCSTLKVLWLDRCKKFDNIGPLAELPKLCELHMNNLSGEICLDPLVSCQDLKELYFYKTRIKPESTKVLCRLKSLKICQFTNFPEPNHVDVELLQRCLPDCDFRVI